MCQLCNCIEVTSRRQKTMNLFSNIKMAAGYLKDLGFIVKDLALDEKVSGSCATTWSALGGIAEEFDYNDMQASGNQHSVGGEYMIGK